MGTIREFGATGGGFPHPTGEFKGSFFWKMPCLREISVIVKQPVFTGLMRCLNSGPTEGAAAAGDLQHSKQHTQSAGDNSTLPVLQEGSQNPPRNIKETAYEESKSFLRGGGFYFHPKECNCVSATKVAGESGSADNRLGPSS